MANEILTSLAWLLAFSISAPLLVISFEVLLGLKKQSSSAASVSADSACILMPAHNEAAILGDTLDWLRPALPEFVRILVIADNCDDSTAEIARSRGVGVVERHDTSRRGKGYALAYGRDWLSSMPPDCVVVLDADCRIDLASLRALIGASAAHGLPIQAAYVLEPDLMASPKVQVSSFAVWVKNIVRQRGAQRMGGAAVLTGTGMAFPWAIFQDLDLATGNIVEDLALSVELTQSGFAPVFLERACVTSLAATEVATLEQRSRWEHGFLAVAQAYSLPAIWAGLRGVDRRLLLLGLHLLVPPLALLLSIAGVAVLLLGLSAFWLDTWLPASILSGLLLLSLGSVFVAWLSGGRDWLSARSLLKAPLYVVWKLPVYLRYALGRKSGWVRTDRTRP